MKSRMCSLLVACVVSLLSIAPVFAQEESVYQDDLIRVVARKHAEGITTWVEVCAWVAGGKPVHLVQVDLALQDFFGTALAVPEVLLLWDENVGAFCNSWPPRNAAKWEIRSVIAFACADGRLSVTHASIPIEAIPPSKLERIREDIRRLQRFQQRFQDCSF